MKRQLWKITLIAGVLSLLWGCRPSMVQQLPGSPGGAPDFKLNDVTTGKPVSLSDFKGKVVVLDFWATWCPPCREEIPHLVDLYGKYKDKNLVIVGVSLDDTQTPVKPFMDEFHMDYPVVMGDDAIQKAYGGIQGIPTAFIIDKTGKIAQKYIGYRDENTFEQQIQKLL